MPIIAVGVNYSSSPLSLRERLSIATHQLPEALAMARGRAEEILLLSTCNRTEAFASVTDQDGASLVALLAEWASLAFDDVAGVAQVRAGRDAANHALRIASGLDSMVLGEEQIQSQFRHALAAARAADTLGPVLDRLGSAALACGKRVRTFTGVGRHSVSLESLAVRTAADALTNLNGRAVVVLGAGESGRLVAQRLQSEGLSSLRIVSRSRDRAEALAREAGGAAAGLAELSDALERADVVFACTSAPHPVLTRDFLTRRLAMRGDAPLLCVDLGMPRAIAQDVAELGTVRMVTLDDLSAAAHAHRQARREHLPAAEAIVESETARFVGWLSARGAAAELADLDARAEELAQAEIARALSRLPDADDITKRIIAELGHRLARKLSHEPKQALKQRAGLEIAAHG